MKLARLQKNLINTFLITTSILTVSIIIVTYLWMLKSDFNAQEMVINREMNALNLRLEEMSKKAKEINEATKLWQSLNIKNKKREGLKIDTAQRLIQSLKSRYRINHIDIDLSTPTELVDIYKTDTVSVMSSDVTIKIKTLTDEQVLSFVDSLMKELPGYIRLKSLSLKRNLAFTNDVIIQISKGELPELVYAEISFQWRDLKDLPNKKAESHTP